MKQNTTHCRQELLDSHQTPLGLRPSAVGGMGSIPAVGTKIPQAIQHCQKTAGTTEVHPISEVSH